MLHTKGWRKITVLSLLFIAVAGFGLLFYSRFTDNTGQPVASNVQGGRQESQTDPLSPTDKAELSQTDLIELAPSAAVASAEASLPASAAPAYKTACQKLKDLYTSEHTDKTNAENSRHESIQQMIINQYSKLGLSFSSKQKSAQSLELRRHDTVMKQLDAQLQRQLHGLSC